MYDNLLRIESRWPDKEKNIPQDWYYSTRFSRKWLNAIYSDVEELREKIIFNGKKCILGFQIGIKRKANRKFVNNDEVIDKCGGKCDSSKLLFIIP